MAWTEDIYAHLEPHDPSASQMFPGFTSCIGRYYIIFSATVPPGREPHYGPISPPRAPQQPTAILQQLPATMMPPGLAPSIRPGGHVKEGLVELMMIQSAQIHQVFMNNVTMSALRSFGYSDTPPGPEEHEADPEIYHYYQSAPYLCHPPGLPPQATLVQQEDPNKPTSAPPRRARPAAPHPSSSSSSSSTRHRWE